MTYSEAKLTEYPPQYERALLINFAAELLARRKFAETGHSGVSWDDWIGNDEDTREERMEPSIGHASSLSAIGMLSWPQAETPGIIWTVEGPGQYRGANAAPALDWVKPCARNAMRAVAYFRACNMIGQPCRLSWSFTPKTRFNLA